MKSKTKKRLVAAALLAVITGLSAGLITLRFGNAEQGSKPLARILVTHGRVPNVDLPAVIKADSTAPAPGHNKSKTAEAQDRSSFVRLTKGKEAVLAMNHPEKLAEKDDSLTKGEKPLPQFDDHRMELTSFSQLAQGSHPYYMTGWLPGGALVLSGMRTPQPTDTGTVSPPPGMGQEQPGQFHESPPVTTPVPEPSTCALMVAGLAAVGLMARRRKQG